MWVICECSQEIKCQPSHGFNTIKVDEFNIVAGTVVLVVQAGVKHQRWNTCHDERVVVGVIGNFPVEDQLQIGSRVRLYKRDS